MKFYQFGFCKRRMSNFRKNIHSLVDGKNVYGKNTVNSAYMCHKDGTYQQNTYFTVKTDYGICIFQILCVHR